nr:MADS-box protein SVP-like [Ipomoea batatas]
MLDEQLRKEIATLQYKGAELMEENNWLKQRDEQFRNEIATLQYKGAELMEENNWLKQRVANDRQNGRIVPGMDRMILDEGQTSESITNNSTTQPPLQAAHCSDTLLKLGFGPISSDNCPMKTRFRYGSGSRRKRTRNLDIVLFEGQEGPSDVAVEAHREAVQEMEFGRFLELQIKVFPTELSYVLLNSYNPINSKLKLKDRLMVDIAEDDAMLDCKDGGVWFKRLFMVLVCSMFIETHQNGTVGIQALYYLDDVLSIPRMNWCSFVMNVLMETSVEWFLKERSFPAFIGWTSDLFRSFPAFIGWSNGRYVPTSSSWTKAVVKKWLNIPSAADEFQSDYTINSRMNIVERRRKSCSNKSGHAVVPDELSGEFLGGSLELPYDG